MNLPREYRNVLYFDSDALVCDTKQLVTNITKPNFTNFDVKYLYNEKKNIIYINKYVNIDTLVNVEKELIILFLKDTKNYLNKDENILYINTNINNDTLNTIIEISLNSLDLIKSNKKLHIEIDPHDSSENNKNVITLPKYDIDEKNIWNS